MPDELNHKNYENTMKYIDHRYKNGMISREYAKSLSEKIQKSYSTGANRKELDKANGR